MSTSDEAGGDKKDKDGGEGEQKDEQVVVIIRCSLCKQIGHASTDTAFHPPDGDIGEQATPFR